MIKEGIGGEKHWEAKILKESVFGIKEWTCIT